jgi:hypothetical protein
MKTKSFLLALFLFPHLGSQLLAQSVSVPTSDGRPVMTDGILEAEEWEDAYELAMGGTALLMVKEHRGHVFVGVDCGSLGKPFVVNLYLKAPGAEILQLHASAQLGERVLAVEGEEDPPWVWGNSSGWYANEVRWNQPMAESLVAEGFSRDEAQRRALFPYDGFEFQLKRSKLHGAEWLMRIEIRHSPDYDTPLVYPEGTDAKSTEGWIRASFGT